MTEPSHFETVGGQAGVDAIVEAFYRHMPAAMRELLLAQLGNLANMLRNVPET